MSAVDAHECHPRVTPMGDTHDQKPMADCMHTGWRRPGSTQLDTSEAALPRLSAMTWASIHLYRDTARAAPPCLHGRHADS